MPLPLSEQIDTQHIVIKRLEMDILKAEEQILMITRDINQQTYRHKNLAQPSPQAIEHHNYFVSTNYLDIEKYQLGIRHYKNLLALAKEQMADLLTDLSKLQNQNTL